MDTELEATTMAMDPMVTKEDTTVTVVDTEVDTMDTVVDTKDMVDTTVTVVDTEEDTEETKDINLNSQKVRESKSSHVCYILHDDCQFNHVCNVRYTS